MRRRSFTAATLAAALSRRALAQVEPEPWPGRRPVRIVYPFAAGGVGDAYARMLAEHCAQALGGTFLVENRTGASGAIGTAFVANQPADGHSFIMNSNSSQVVAPLVLRDPGFDPMRSLSPVTRLYRYGMYLLINPRIPARTVGEFVAWAKAQRRGVNMASVGVGSVGHLTAEMFSRRAGFAVEHIPYRGGPTTLLALAQGEADYVFDSVGNAQPTVKEGMIRGLAVTGLRRSPAVPEIPTILESGFQGFEDDVWFALYAPAGTPRTIIDAMNAETRRFLNSPTFQARLAANAHEGVGSTPEEVMADIVAETPRWEEVIRTLRIEKQ